MKCQIPEISWHNRDPVLSVDFQPKNESTDDIIRLASGGSDSHVLIWHLMHDEGAIRFDLAADLTRHQRAVNCVRWSPNGQLLASCDDESFIFIWKQKPDSEAIGLFDRDDASDGDKETWLSFKTLRGHMEDIYDLSFSPDSQFIMSGSVDNTAIVWDIEKAKSVTILQDHKGFVQGVAWDPLNKYLASLSTDRFLRIFDVQSKKMVQKNYKSLLPVAEESPFFKKNIKLFHDDTLQTFFRRLSFSPDGSLLVVPSGFMEIEGESTKPLNATYIYTRYSLKEPALILPSPDQYTVAVRFCPVLFEMRESKAASIIDLPYRMIFAVATKSSVYLYDTQQKIPFGLISNIHYTRLTDMSWSNDGRVLLVSSTDGYCSIVNFSDGELGNIYQDKKIQDILTEKTTKDEPKKKKKKSKKSRKSNVNDEKRSDESAEKEKENEEEKMDIDELNIPDSIKEMVPVDKIIKSNDMFSPEKQVGSPVTPIQIRKCPRVPDEIRDLADSEKKMTPVKDATPKSFSHNKTPNRIEVRRYPRNTFPQAAPATHKDEDDWPKPIVSTDSPKEKRLPTDSPVASPAKTPRRVELHTITTPKSKKKLL